MNLKSLRFQLPLTYAGIALLTALALGAVLILTLREYYLHQERSYLQGNALAMRNAVAQLVEADLPPEVLKAQIENLSFLALARIRVLDANGTLLIDSGIPNAIHIASLSSETGPTQFFVSAAPLPDADPIAGGGEIGTEVMFIKGNFFQDSVVPAPIDRMSLPLQGDEFTVQGDVPPGDVVGFVAPLGQSLYGYDLAASAAEVKRSHEVAIVPLATFSGEEMGSLQLSDGPAYGREIVRSVALAWGVSGVMAVILAAGAGGWISRRMAAPVLALTTVTEQMAAGNLSVRAEVAAPEELAMLGQSFNEMAARIEEMISTLRNFVSDAAHELHTPLTALRTDLEMASQSGQHYKNLVDRALTQADRLQTLVNHLLDLSRIESQEYPHTEVNLATLLKEMEEMYASRAEQAGLVFELEGVDVEAQVRGNEMQLRSAIGNLIENAIKFTPEGGQVQVGLEAEEEGWQVWVKDTGVGIPPEELPYLFRRFHRTRNVTEYPGNGLGLAIVKAIANTHDGRVAVENQDPGARFSIWLPG